jgi:hypothetical protein
MENSITLNDLFQDTNLPHNPCAGNPQEVAQLLSDLIIEKHETSFNTFDCFPNLPLELRQLIWKYTLPRRRNINLAPKAMVYRSTKDAPITFPVALQVNRESREVAIKLWKDFILFNQQRHPAFQTEYRPWRSLFDPIVDVPYIKFCDLSTRSVWQHLNHPGPSPCSRTLYNHVDCLEIRDVDWIIGRPKLGIEDELKNLDHTILDYFQNLKEIILIPFFKRFNKETMPAEGFTAWINRDMEKAVRDLTLWYQAKHKKDGRLVPEIIINKWRGIGALTDKERNLLKVSYPWLAGEGNQL